MTGARGQRGWRLLALVASLGVLLLMWLPVVDPLPEIKLWYEDKWQHMLTYAVLTGVWVRSGALPRNAALGVLLWSVVLEFGQLLLPYRGFEVLDILANALGCLLTWAIFAVPRPQVTVA